MKNFIKVLIYVIASVTIVNAWEINTHRAIDRCAISSECGGQRSLNLHQLVQDTQIESDDYKDEIFESYTTRSGGDVTYFNYAIDGEKYGVSKWNQTFGSHTYQDLIEAGTILEDSLLPGINRYIISSWDPDGGRGRFGNHFYDPQNGGAGLSIVPGFANTDAITWAFEDDANRYNFQKANEAFFTGFSAQSEKVRIRARAKMFVTLGFMLHMLNDMNVPAHTRDDSHPLGDPLEAWMRGGEKGSDKGGFRIDRYDLSGKNDDNIKTIVNSATAFRYNSFNDFYKTEAIYTGTHFYSEDSISVNGGTFGGYGSYHPTKDEVEVYEGDETGYITSKALASHKKLAMMRKSKIWIDGPVVTFFHPYFYSMQYNGDTSVLEDNGIHLIPRAIANAEGFVNYFFRGRIESELTKCGLEVTNKSNEGLVAAPSVVTFKAGGVFKVYADDPLNPEGNRVFLAEKALPEDMAVDDTLLISGIAAAYKSKLGEPTMEVPLTVVYTGNIGEDIGVAVSYGEYDPSKFEDETSTPHPGAVQVTLSWKEAQNDFDLSLGMPQSVKDVQTCRMEHAYVSTEYQIYPGRYPVGVTYANEAYVDDTVYVSISAPGAYKLLKLDTNTSGFNPGHVADIVVKYVKNEPVLELEPVVPVPVFSAGGGSTVNFGHIFIGGSSTGSGSDTYIPDRYVPPIPCSPAKSCGCMPCEYEIIVYLSQALMGPLSGADIALYTAQEYSAGSAFYEGKTTDGNDLYSSGLLNIPGSIIKEIDDDALYVLQVSGGSDIDFDDNMMVDNVFTLNTATLHAVLKGSDLKNSMPKVSIVTEIAYQIVEEALMMGETQEKIIETLDDVAKRMLIMKIYPESGDAINHTDLLEWMPALDKPILMADYESKIEPLITKLRAGADIYQDAYNVVYYPDGVLPIIESDVFNVTENIPVGTAIGQIKIASQGASAVTQFELFGEDKAAFSLDNNGTLKTAIVLDYETKMRYTLYVRAQNSEGHGKYTALYVQVQDVVDAPYAVSFLAEQVYADASVGSVIAQIVFEAGAGAITSIRLEGEDAKYFAVDTNGTITLQTPFEDFFVKKAYAFNVIATNSAGDSRPVSIVINIADRRDIPTIAPFYGDVDENATEGTPVGSVSIVSDGDAPVLSFDLNDTSRFVIDANGTLYVAPGAHLDYETQSVWHISVTASNLIGDSRPKDVEIHLNDVADLPPVLTDINISIDKGTTVGTVVGNVLVSVGDSALSALTLAPASPFGIGIDGKIYVETSLLDQNSNEFSLKALATNIAGQSEANINVWLDTTPRVEDASIKIFDYLSAGSTIGKVSVVANGNAVESLTLSGEGSEDFNIALDGTLTTTVKIQASKQNYYRLHVTLNNLYEAEVEISVSDRIIGMADTPGYAQRIILSPDGSKAYVADGSSGLQIIDVSDPAAPAIIGSVDTSGSALGITLSPDGSKAYVADTYSDLQVIDVSDPAAPAIIGSVDTPGDASGVTFSPDGSKAYVADGYSGLQVIDVSDPAAPAIIGSVDTPGNASGVTFSPDGSKAYVLDYSSGLQVIDLTGLE